MAPKGTQQVRTLQDVQCKLKDCADAEAVWILEGADVILKGNQNDMRRLCSKWKGVKRYKDKKDRPDKELREDLKSAVLKAASEFLARQADVLHDVSGGASGSTEGRERLATGASAAPPLASAESVASARASSSTIDASVDAAPTSNRKRGGGDHPAADAPKRLATRSAKAELDRAPGVACGEPKVPQGSPMPVSETKRGGGDHPAADAPKRRATRSSDAESGQVSRQCEDP